MFWRKRKPKPVYTCEICKSSGVRRIGNWDHCPKGHSYIGVRAENQPQK